MLLPAQWNELLRPGYLWKEAYPVVEKTVRDFLSHSVLFHDGQTCSTTELVEYLYPEQHVRGDGAYSRQYLFDILPVLAKNKPPKNNLADCASRGEMKVNKYNKRARPWRWHAPTDQAEVADEVCPTCGKKL